MANTRIAALPGRDDGSGLTVHARLDERAYPKAITITDDQLAAVNLTTDPFHPEWNYTIHARDN